MDHKASLESSSDDQKVNKWVRLGIFSAFLLVALLYAFYMISRIDRITFSMEPVAHAGFDLTADPATPPSFNVTLHARSTYPRTLCVGEDSGATLEVAYAGMVIAKADVAPFCILQGKEADSVIKATATSGWPALPTDFRERVESDRRHGGVELEVDLSFGAMWVRCRSSLDAKHAASSSCQYFTFMPPGPA